MQISKSKYCLAYQCQKLLWLNKYKPEFEIKDPSLTARMESGHEIGNLAKRLFGEYVDTTSYTTDSQLNFNQMIATTKECINNNISNICEATFSNDNLFCSVDILHKENDGYSIYEVKSSTNTNSIYFADIAFQKYV